MANTPKQAKPGDEDIARGPNEEAVTTAQENVTEGYGASGKAAIISGKPDGDKQHEAKHRPGSQAVNHVPV
ncbi:hypothetical protein EIP75_19300 [Aquabacterium soli]|uniref:Uncharacterized protein n=1 Tax=Aquabacterium soli TaxID=2493092 RepID=A0A426V711_9BURK|nr:hypothetical protein [Aquabacterium soli]RRS02729.1 hypothetical protein EIP75_19300 [Aquabacterium soli]